MQGTCISMPALYIALGERLGCPIKGVNANEHFFCRWDDGKYVSNIEVTSGGGWSPDEDYVRDMEMTPEQLRSGAYMRTLTKRELIGNFFFARAAHYASTGRPLQAERDLLRVAACNPRDVDAFSNPACLYARTARRLGKRPALEDLPPPSPVRGALPPNIEAMLPRPGAAADPGLGAFRGPSPRSFRSSGAPDPAGRRAFDPAGQRRPPLEPAPPDPRRAGLMDSGQHGRQETAPPHS
jgi:hypothetical protein